MTRLSMKFGMVCILILGLIGTLNAAQITLAQSPAPASTLPDVNFPDLTGPYQVGRLSYEWVDTSRDEPFSSIPGLKRDLMVYVWFPASPTKRSKIAPYMDGGLMWTIWSQHPLPILTISSPTSGLEGFVHSHAYRTNALNADQSSYPVLIFAPGYNATSLNYASILEDIASHGYIVIGTSHPYTTPVISYPDGRLVTSGLVGAAIEVLEGGTNDQLPTIWTQDLAFVLDQLQQFNATDKTFASHLDLNHIGVFGNNMGGAAAYNLAAADSRVQAAAALSLGIGQTTLTGNISSKPFLGIGEYFVSNADDIEKKTQYRLNIDNTHYLNFGDFPFLVPLLPEMKQGQGYGIEIGDIDPARGIQITNSYLLAFFDHYLKGADLNWPTFPEAHLTTAG